MQTEPSFFSDLQELIQRRDGIERVSLISNNLNMNTCSYD